MVMSTVFLVYVFAGAVLGSPLVRDTNVTTTTCNGQQYVFKGLAGYGFTPSNTRDKFGDTAGGIGSSAALDITTWKKDGDVYTGVLYALPDRGWNTEGTLNYQPRVHKFSITLTLNSSASVADPAPPNLRLEYLDTTRFVGPEENAFSGLDPDFTGPYLSLGSTELPSAHYQGDGFGGEGSGGNRPSLDSEGMVLNSDGTYWISDEYGPYIYHFSTDGKIISAIPPPPAVLPRRNDTVSFSAASPPRYDDSVEVIPENPDSGRSNNQGLEGLTASADGKTLWALIQSALTQDGGTTNAGRRYARLFKYDITEPATPTYLAEYVVPLPKYVNADDKTRVAAQSEIKLLSDTQFLILARDSGAGHGADNSLSRYRHADIFDISAATDIKGDKYDCPTCSIASTDGELKDDIKVAEYCSFLDFNINSELAKFGLHNGGEQDSGLLNEKWESLALAPVHPEGKSSWNDWDGKADGSGEYFLFSLSDNDFITQDGYMNGGELPYADESGFSLDNQVLVFHISLPKGSKPRLG